MREREDNCRKTYARNQQINGAWWLFRGTRKASSSTAPNFFSFNKATLSCK